MADADVPPAISIVGRKNSGKTTFLVALAAELKRRGLRVATVKHGHHAFEIDHPGTDSWRHFHEGEAEAVVFAADDRLALVMRLEEPPTPESLLRGLLGGRGYDLVLVEGFKYRPLPKIEVFRRDLHDRPLLETAAPESARRFLALVTDDPALRAACPVVPLDPERPAGSHVGAVADLLVSRFPPATRGR